MNINTSNKVKKQIKFGKCHIYERKSYCHIVLFVFKIQD